MIGVALRPTTAPDEHLAGAVANGQLRVAYQPILSFPGAHCTAVEALVRWQHPDRGLLHPADFLGDAERTGALGRIGDFVLARACADAATWRDVHPRSPLTVHVNISASQLEDPGFLGAVTRRLQESRLAPRRLVLEVTEAAAFTSADAIARLVALAALGVRIALDDFGTGYCSLATLTALPLHIVKIDRSLVAGSMLNARDRAFTRAAVAMAAELGLRTIAEGVERPEQRSFLTRLDVGAMQGYLFLRPTGAEQFGAWLGRQVCAPD